MVTGAGSVVCESGLCVVGSGLVTIEVELVVIIATEDVVVAGGLNRGFSLNRTTHNQTYSADVSDWIVVSGACSSDAVVVDTDSSEVVGGAGRLELT